MFICAFGNAKVGTASKKLPEGMERREVMGALFVITVDGLLSKIEDTIFEEIKVLHIDSPDKNVRIKMDFPTLIEENLEGRRISEGSQLRIFISKKDERLPEDVHIELSGTVFKVVNQERKKTFYISIGGLIMRIECDKEAALDLSLYDKLNIGIQILK